MSTCPGETLNDTSPMLCMFVSGHTWDHYLLFALNEINSGMYQSTMGNITFQHKLLYANATSPAVGGEVQALFSSNYQSCHLFVGPGWANQLSPIGEWASLERKPIVSGRVTSPIFSEDIFGYVSRTTPSASYLLEASVELIVHYKFRLINVVYVDSETGRAARDTLKNLAGNQFKIQEFSFESAKDLDGINKVLDDLKNSLTKVTFVATTIPETPNFLNTAGKRGMHEDYLWLCPAALYSLDALDPSTGGIWGVDFGEDLTEDNPLAQRYLAKDVAPHIEAQQYGLKDDYDVLTVWGPYAYDAVLVSAYGLAAPKNRSDGEQVLREIRGLSLDNANTGVLQMDENGDRIRARIPVKYIKPDGTVEQFAVYSNETLDFLQDPMWPGGSTTMPLLVEEPVDTKTRGLIIGGVLLGTLVLFVTASLIYYRKSKREIANQREIIIRTQSALDKRENELKELHESMQTNIGSTKFGDAVSHIETLIDKENDQEEIEKLRLIKTCMIRGNDNSVHIPKNLSAEDEAFIMKEFAGLDSSRKMKRQAATRIRYRPSVVHFNDIVMTTNNSLTSQNHDCLPEFTMLEVSKQMKLFELLSFDSLKQWGFNIFDIAKIDEKNALLFVSWAVICSPYSQIAMSKELRNAGVETALKEEDFVGYDFTDLELAVDYKKFINYVRLIQEGYRDTPYHNRVHAADVVQTLNSLLQMAQDKFPIDKEDIFLILVSAVVHDVLHPGKNNAFQVNTFSELALNWNDISVLESEHVSYAFKCMLNNKDCQFITNADQSKMHEMRKKIIDAVLHTDMSKHFAGVSKIKAAAAGKSWDELEPHVHWEVLMYVLHMADISNPTKPDPMCKLWTDRCLDEFFEQGDKEKEIGISVSPNCDRTTTKKPDSQIGFIKFVVKPAYEVLSEIIPDVQELILPVIDSNLEYWGSQKALEDAVE